MEVIVFDLVPYAEHLFEGGEMPWPLPKTHFDPEVGARTYREHLDAWAELDRLGYDAVGFNEHHTSPYGLMTSPNLLAAAATQRTERLRLCVYGNLPAIQEPVRLAEELAMLDCMSDGRITCGLARGIPREHQVYGIPLTEVRARFEEAWEIIRGLWTEEVFSYEGRFWSYRDVSIWPRPVQQPHPPIWTPISSSKESIEWAGRNNASITPGGLNRGLREDVVRYYARCLREHGHSMTPDHIHLQTNAYVADSKEQAIAEAGPYLLYFNELFRHGSLVRGHEMQRQAGYVSDASLDYVRPENRAAAEQPRSEFHGVTLDDVARQAQTWPWGSADEVVERILSEAEHVGAGKVLVNLNRGAMPQEMFLNQIHRFAEEVLPQLHAYTATAPEWLVTA